MKLGKIIRTAAAAPVKADFRVTISSTYWPTIRYSEINLGTTALMESYYQREGHRALTAFSPLLFQLLRLRFTFGLRAVPAEDIVCGQRLVETLQGKLTKRFHLHRLGYRGQHARRDHYLAGPCLIAKPRRKIYDATDRCVLPTLLEADLSDGRKAGSDPNSKSKFVALASPLCPEFVHSFPHVQRQPDGTLGVIDTWNWIVEHNHDPVTEEPFERALVTEDEFSQVLVVFTQDRQDLFGFGCLGKVGKATQIAEYDRDLLSMTGQHRIGQVGRRYHLHHLRRQKSLQTTDPFNFRQLFCDALLKQTIPAGK